MNVTIIVIIKNKYLYMKNEIDIIEIIANGTITYDEIDWTNLQSFVLENLIIKHNIIESRNGTLYTGIIEMKNNNARIVLQKFINVKPESSIDEQIKNAVENEDYELASELYKKKLENSNKKTD